MIARLLATRLEALTHLALPGSVARELDQFTLLSRDSVRSLLSAASMSRDADSAPFALWGTALVAVPPAMYAFRELFNYSAMRFAPFAVVDAAIQSDRMFFLLYGMLAAALLAAVTWESLLPDRLDQDVIGTLPVRPRTLAAARLAAALVVATILAAAISLPAAAVLALAAPSHSALGFLPTVFVAHVVTTMGASLFAFAALLIARGAIACCFGESVAERLATILQLATVAALAEVFFLLPGVLPALVNRMVDGDVVAMALPPVWFAALYSWLVGTPHAALASTASLAPIACVCAIALVVPVYLLPAAALARRMAETQRRQRLGAISSLARGAAMALPTSAGARGIAVFAVASLMRSPRHRLIVAAYAGLAVAVGTISILAGSIRETIVLEHPSAPLLSLPLLVIFFVALGLRTAFAIPSDVNANWPFRLARPTVMTAVDATALTILLVAACPVAAAASAGAFALGWGLGLSITVGIVNLLSAIVLVEWMLRDWRKVPFTCAYLPDAESFKSRWATRLVPLMLFAFVNAAVQASALHSTRTLLVYVAAAATAFAALRIRRQRRVSESSLQFDASDADEMATLNLSEALR